eukprot:gene6594-3249_t
MSWISAEARPALQALSLLKGAISSSSAAVSQLPGSSTRCFASKGGGEDKPPIGLPRIPRSSGRYGVRLRHSDSVKSEFKFNRMRAVLGYKPTTEWSAKPSKASSSSSSSSESSEGIGRTPVAVSSQVTVSILQMMHYLKMPSDFTQKLALYRVGTLSHELDGNVSKAQSFLKDFKAKMKTK